MPRPVLAVPASRAAALGALLAVLLTAAPPATAAPSYGPRLPVAAPACARSGVPSSADAAFGGGQVRVVAGFYGRACGGRVEFASGGSQGWVRTASPYRGVVLAVAADATATYVLHVVWDAAGTPSGLGLGTRTHAGRFLPVRVLSRTAGTGAVPTTGDVAARDGRWWAVWSEQVGPGGENAHNQLFQAGTWGAVPRSRTQVTSTAPAIDDAEPSIALDAQGAVIAWTRQEAPARPGPADLWVAVSPTGTWQRARAFSTTGTHNSDPDVVRAGGATVLGWSRDGRVVEADNSTGTFREHVFGVRGGEARVGLANGNLVVSWTAGTETDTSHRVLSARAGKGGAAWESAYLTSVGEPLQAMVTVNGRATVLATTRTSVFSRTG